MSAETCAACEAALLDVDFNKAKSPLPGDGTQHTGCVFCDPIFQGLVELKHAASCHPMHRGPGRRQGRGRQISGGTGFAHAMTFTQSASRTRC